LGELGEEVSARVCGAHFQAARTEGGLLGSAEPELTLGKEICAFGDEPSHALRGVGVLEHEQDQRSVPQAISRVNICAFRQ
jgi:hypothetical protein